MPCAVKTIFGVRPDDRLLGSNSNLAHHGDGLGSLKNSRAKDPVTKATKSAVGKRPQHFAVLRNANANEGISERHLKIIQKKTKSGFITRSLSKPAHSLQNPVSRELNNASECQLDLCRLST